MELRKIEYTEDVEKFLQDCLHNELYIIEDARVNFGNDITGMSKQIVDFLESHLTRAEFHRNKDRKQKVLDKLTDEEKELLGL